MSPGNLLTVELKCPNLHTLKLHEDFSPCHFADELLQYFPKLEKWQCYSLSFESIQSYEYQNQKELTVDSIFHSNKNSDVLNFVQGCKNLEAFSMKIDFDAEEMKELLHCCPKLKSLCIRRSSKEMFKVVKKYGKKSPLFAHRSWTNRCQKSKVGQAQKVLWWTIHRIYNDQQRISWQRFQFFASKIIEREKML